VHPWARKALKVVAIVVGVPAAMIGYAMITEPRAEKKARQFCAELRLGMSTEGLELRAKDAGAKESLSRWYRPPYERPVLYVTFIGASPFSRHSCVVMGDKTIEQLEYNYMD
jgi:hypothetical protein